MNYSWTVLDVMPCDQHQHFCVPRDTRWPALSLPVSGLVPCLCMTSFAHNSNLSHQPSFLTSSLSSGHNQLYGTYCKTLPWLQILDCTAVLIGLGTPPDILHLRHLQGSPQALFCSAAGSAHLSLKTQAANRNRLHYSS